MADGSGRGGTVLGPASAAGSPATLSRLISSAAPISTSCTAPRTLSLISGREFKRVYGLRHFCVRESVSSGDSHENFCSRYFRKRDRNLDE
uniref:Uncharacterized protein n=1 Tax=Anguilla anguilla TaxID=7936 RepID=A0A0E9WZU7_ANGAN